MLGLRVQIKAGILTLAYRLRTYSGILGLARQLNARSIPGILSTTGERKPNAAGLKLNPEPLDKLRQMENTAGE